MNYQTNNQRPNSFQKKGEIKPKPKKLININPTNTSRQEQVAAVKDKKGKNTVNNKTKNQWFTGEEDRDTEDAPQYYSIGEQKTSNQEPNIVNKELDPVVGHENTEISQISQQGTTQQPVEKPVERKESKEADKAQPLPEESHVDKEGRDYDKGHNRQPYKKQGGGHQNYYQKKNNYRNSDKNYEDDYYNDDYGHNNDYGNHRTGHYSKEYGNYQSNNQRNTYQKKGEYNPKQKKSTNIDYPEEGEKVEKPIEKTESTEAEQAQPLHEAPHVNNQGRDYDKGYNKQPYRKQGGGYQNYYQKKNNNYRNSDKHYDDYYNDDYGYNNESGNQRNYYSKNSGNYHYQPKAKNSDQERVVYVEKN